MKCMVAQVNTTEYNNPPPACGASDESPSDKFSASFHGNFPIFQCQKYYIVEVKSYLVHNIIANKTLLTAY
jgi:hypothetical protein